MYLIDTNVISETRKFKPHGAVIAWLKQADEHGLFLSAVTLGEIQAGIEVTRDQDAHKANELETWLEQISEAFGVLPMDGKIFRVWAQLMHTRSSTISEDLMIAATAMVHDLTVVTRNTADFRGLGVRLLNPFKA